MVFSVKWFSWTWKAWFKKKKIPNTLEHSPRLDKGYVWVALEINSIVQWNNKIQKRWKACVLSSVTARVPALHKLGPSQCVLSLTAEPWWDGHRPEKPPFLAWVVYKAKDSLLLRTLKPFSVLPYILCFSVPGCPPCWQVRIFWLANISEYGL